jgi:hypothetical protein
MPCIKPINVKNKKTKQDMLVPCGKCYACLQKRRSHWTFRLMQEAKSSSSAKFITLTFNDDMLHHSVTPDGELTIKKEHIQNFMKRYRKRHENERNIYDKPLKYFATGEYGSRTDRPHYHLILFNLVIDENTSDRIQKAWSYYDNKTHTFIPYGNIHVGKVNNASIHYITKYLIDYQNEDKTNYTRQKPFNLMSKKPPIGSSYFKNADVHRLNNDFCGVLNGSKIDLPRIYKDKFFSEFQKKDRFYKMLDEAEKRHLKFVEKHGDNWQDIKDQFFYLGERKQKLKSKQSKF